MAKRDVKIGKRGNKRKDSSKVMKIEDNKEKKKKKKKKRRETGEIQKGKGKGKGLDRTRQKESWPSLERTPQWNHDTFACSMRAALPIGQSGQFYPHLLPKILRCANDCFRWISPHRCLQIQLTTLALIGRPRMISPGSVPFFCLFS